MYAGLSERTSRRRTRRLEGRDPSTALPLALLAVTSLRMTGVYSRDGGRAGGATGKLHRSFAAHRTRDSG